MINGDKWNKITYILSIIITSLLRLSKYVLPDAWDKKS